MHPPFYLPPASARPVTQAPPPAREIMLRSRSESRALQLPPPALSALAEPPPRTTLAELARGTRPPPSTAPPRPSLRARIGQLLIRLGTRLAQPTAAP